MIDTAQLAGLLAIVTVAIVVGCAAGYFTTGEPQP